MKLKDQNILIISNEPWGDFWYSKHNYAYELSKKNRVFFLNPPIAFAPKNTFKKKIEEKIIDLNLTVVEYKNILPVSFFNFWKINDVLILKALNNYFQTKNIANILFWTFDPIRLGFPEILKPKKIILHAVDDYLFSYPSEILLARKADHIICVSDNFSDKYKKYNSNVQIIPHAIPDDEFLPPSQLKNKTITGIFIGKIDNRIDIEFNIAVFKAFPKVNFRIIGKASAAFLDRLKNEKLNNVTVKPPVKSGELKNHISESDFCFIFKKIYKGNNIYSHKLLQYLAQGKPIFGTEFSDINPELKNTLYLNNDVNEIKKHITAFCKDGESAAKADMRISFARQHTFSSTFLTIERFLN